MRVPEEGQRREATATTQGEADSQSYPRNVLHARTSFGVHLQCIGGIWHAVIEYNVSVAPLLLWTSCGPLDGLLADPSKCADAKLHPLRN
jgi:hypothetical protein